MIAANVFVAAEIHCLNQLFMSFRKALAKAEDPQRPILGSLCGLLGLTNIQRHAGLFLQFGYFKPEHMPSIGSAVLELMQTIRLQVIPLTDAFGLSDFVINSPLGCYDGDVYRRLMERVLQSNPQGPHPYFERAIKPMLFRTKQEPDAIQMQE